MVRARVPLAVVAVALVSWSLTASIAAADDRPRPLLQGLAFPTNMAFLPDGTLLFTEKETGSVRVVTPDGALLEQPFITLPVIGDLERGLLGIAVHPDFPAEPWVYLYRSDPSDGRNTLVRVRAGGLEATGEPEMLLEGLPATAGYHNGGDLAFAADGTLFVSLGEAHEPERAQDPADIGGKILRLATDGSVPADNPFGAANPVWSIGHRNSFGLCVDPRSGDLWETENGPDRDDEVNLIEEGRNYGWPVVTGVANDERFVDPVAVFPEPVAVTGCAVLDGVVWFGSFDGRVWRLPASGNPVEVARLSSGVTDLALGPDGLVYVSTADAISTIDPATADAPPGDASPSADAAPPVGDDAVSPAEASDRGGQGWVAGAAGVVLAAALIVRFLAGRRSRRTR
jgi:glucose/arabinose dehydrogenase